MITEEQRQRMEENRRKALEIRMKKQSQVNNSAQIVQSNSMQNADPSAKPQTAFAPCISQPSTSESTVRIQSKFPVLLAPTSSVGSNSSSGVYSQSSQSSPQSSQNLAKRKNGLYIG